MKNYYPKTLLQDRFNQFQILKKDLHYREGFLLLKNMQLLCTYGILSAAYSKAELEELVIMQFTMMQEMRFRWGLMMPITPDLRISASDLTAKTIRPRSSLAQLVFAYGLSNDSTLIDPSKPKKIKISDLRVDLELRTQKYLVYTLHSKSHATFRKLGRIFNRDKDTIKAWVQEMSLLPEPEKIALTSELLTSRPLKNIDVMDMGPYKLTSFNENIHYAKDKDGGHYNLDENEDYCFEGRARTNKDYYEDASDSTEESDNE
ncbi:MAG: hypothetical protein WCI27_11500 [Candidatus Omnitrophota bacterium]